MRVATLFSALTLVPLAAAQRPTEPHEQFIWDAYQNFRVDSDTYAFELKGTDRGTAVHAVLYWRTSTDSRTGTKSRAEVDLTIYTPTSTGERPSMRIVGDGTNLYRYDLDRSTVATTAYGFLGQRPPEGYATNVKSDAPKLQTQLRSATPGLPTYLARLLSEVNLANGIDFGPRFASWSPGAAPLFFDEVPVGPRQINGALAADDTVTDPLTGRTFVRGSDRYVFYGMDQASPSRTVAFRLIDADGDPSNGSERWEVQQINLALQTPGRLVDLTITPQTTTTLPNWAFIPYYGAQAAAFRPTNTGG